MPLSSSFYIDFIEVGKSGDQFGLAGALAQPQPSGADLQAHGARNAAAHRFAAQHTPAFRRILRARQFRLPISNPLGIDDRGPLAACANRLRLFAPAAHCLPEQQCDPVSANMEDSPCHAAGWMAESGNM
jgi:hypothetical protein